MSPRVLQLIGLTLLLLGLLYFPLFQHLDGWVIRMWDEARLVISAIEMAENGNALVTHYEGEPDLWSTKPPLLIWWQAIGFQCLGWTELAFRIPVALTALFLCYSLFRFGWKQLQSPFWGFAAAMVLVTIPGFVGWHTSRTGDYDVPLTLFTTLAGLAWFLALENQGKRRQKWVFLTFFSLACAVLTKGVAGLMFAPAFLLYSIARKQLFSLLKTPGLYAAFGLFIGIIAAYYGLREGAASGYLEAVWNNELGGRYLQKLEGHQAPFGFYFSNWIEGRWHWLVLLMVPLGALSGIFGTKGPMQRFTWFSVLAAITFFLVISGGQTKIQWYDTPAFPWMAALVATFLWVVVAKIGQLFSFFQRYPGRWALCSLLLIISLAYPYAMAVERTYHPQEVHWDKPVYAIAYFLRTVQRGQLELDQGVVVAPKYPHVNEYYLKSLRAMGKDFESKPLEALKPGDWAIANYPEDKAWIEAHFVVKATLQQEEVAVFQLIAPKSSAENSNSQSLSHVSGNL